MPLLRRSVIEYLIGFYMIAPWLIAWPARILARLLGCQPGSDELVRPYFAWGWDVGSALGGLSMAGMLLLITIPTGGLALILYSTRTWVADMRKENKAEPSGESVS